MFRKLTLAALSYIVTVALMALQKPLFLLWYAPRAAEATAAELAAVSLHGLLLDSTTAGYIAVAPWLLMLAAVWIPVSERAMRRMLDTYFIIISVIVALIVSVDMGLFRYWDFRLDSTVLLYLRTPKEAAASVTAADMWPSLALFVAYGATMIAAYLPLSKIYRAERASLGRRASSSLALLLCGGLLFLAIRGGTSTAPANVSKVYFSDNMFLNQAATNPVFSFLASAASPELAADDYRYFSDSERERIFGSLRGGHDATAHTTHVLATRRPNVVLVLLESFGRTVTDAVIDGDSVTPNLARAAREGIRFDNMIANSFRTDRGQAAVMSGFPAHPVVSIMKNPNKAHTLPAIARSLRREGYTTTFTYGGDADFTNTMSYLYGTGIERVTDQRDLRFDAPTAKWGYADDVVCDYFANEVLELAAEGHPFFATLLTLSSHEPFDVPYDRFENRILNAAAFTDRCVGQMLDRWRRSSAWDDMLVILVADHGIAYPDDLQIGELARQRIPMIWTGGAVREPMEIDTYASQIDLAPTLLAQMDIDRSEFVYGTDIFDPSEPHFGFWTFNNAFGMIDGGGYVVYNCTADAVTDSAGDANTIERLAEHGKAIVQTLHDDIRQR